MLETYAIGVNFQMTSNATSVVDRLLAEMQRLNGVVGKTRERVSGMIGSFREMRRAASDVEAMARALERLNRGAGAGGSRGGARGGRAGSPLDGLHAQGRYDNRLHDALMATERRRAEHEDRLFNARQTLIRREAEHENRVFDTRQRAADRAAKAAERAATASFRDDYRAAHQENANVDRRRRSAQRNSTERGHAWVQAGMGGQMVGGAALHGAESALERGIEVAHLRTQLLSDQRVTPERADALVRKAYDATASAPGTTVKENLHALIDAKSVVGSLDEAEHMLPRIARLTALLKVMDKKKGGDGAFAAFKAMEIVGGMIEDKVGPNGETVHEVNPALLQKRLDMMARVSVATNSRVAPQEYLNFAKQARVAGMTLNDEFLYEKLPALMMVMGGHRAGTALMSATQVYRGGSLTPKSMQGLIDVGLASPEGITLEPNHRGKLVQKVHADKIYDAALMRTDPAAWVMEASKRMDAKGIHGSTEQIEALMKVSQRSTIAGLFADLLKDAPAILKEQENIRNTRPDVAEHFAQNDPAAKMQQLQAAFDKLMTTLGGAAMTDAVRLMDAATSGLNKLGDWAEAHPTMARILTDTALGLGAVGTALGALSTAIFLFGPALKLMGITGGAATAAGGTAASVAAGGASGGILRAALSGGLRAGAAAFPGAAIVGGIVAAHEAMSPLTEDQKRRITPMLAEPQDGYGYAPQRGTVVPPINLNLEIKVEGKVDSGTIMSIVTSGIARIISGPNGGTTSFDPKAGLHGGIGALP